jgi:hypothetical protein
MAVDIDAETRLIRSVWDDAVVALTTKDWEAYSRFWAHQPDIQVIHPAERDWTCGWEQVESKYRAVMESPVTLSATTRRFEVDLAPSGDVAWAAIEAAIGVNGVEHVSWQIVVFQRLQGRWRAVLALDAALPEPTRVASAREGAKNA